MNFRDEALLTEDEYRLKLDRDLWMSRARRRELRILAAIAFLIACCAARCS